MKNLIKGIINEMSYGSPPTELILSFGSESFQNLTDYGKGINVIVDEPIRSNLRLYQSNYLEETGNLVIFFLSSTEFLTGFADNENLIKDMKDLAKKFIIRLNDKLQIREVADMNLEEMENLFDSNLSGIKLEMNVTLYNTESNCYD